MLIILEMYNDMNEEKIAEDKDNKHEGYKRSGIDLRSRIMKRNAAQFRQVLSFIKANNGLQPHIDLILMQASLPPFLCHCL